MYTSKKLTKVTNGYDYSVNLVIQIHRQRQGMSHNEEVSDLT